MTTYVWTISQYGNRRYGQIWSLLIFVDGVACQKYKPGPCEEAIDSIITK